MRQAGRYLPEYRALRRRHSLLEICRTPELAARVTLQPLARFDLDAAILFSDLLIPLEPLGFRVQFTAGEGPVVDRPIRSAADIDRLARYEPREALGFVAEAARIARAELDGRVPLIGFAGAPFTLASYAIEGGPSTSFARTKALMFADPAAWHRLAALLADLVVEFLAVQIEAGVDAVQVFDSWVGALGPADYREFVLPHMRGLFERLQRFGIPAIHFGVGTTALLELMREAGGDVVGVDWRVPLDDAWARIGWDRAIQGNLDPALLLGTEARLLDRAADVLRRAGGRPGHIFNLGHGVLPATPPSRIEALVRFVHDYRR
ncbi:MAG TPA: uroporphyrinogen decarboxylase [Vicinamibacterales bacterium]|nr:uroporphyrinogen decarboxylase [Vicinamibacterales bacterium]